VSEKILLDSLAKLSTKRSPASRSGETKSGGASPTKSGFDGLLQSYLGRKDRTGAGRNGGKSALLFDPLGGSPGSLRKKSKFDEEKDAIRRKAEEAEEAGEQYADQTGVSSFAEFFALLVEDGPMDDSIAEAAAEAAKIILDLFREGGAAAAADGSAGSALAELFPGASGSARSGLGAGAIQSSEMAGALDAANVSAEMNNAAVLATLGELLAGMPKNALEQALRDLSAGKPGDGGIVETMLAALNGTVVSGGGEAAAADLLARLGLQDNVSGKLAAEAANNAGETDLNGAFEKNLADNSGKISNLAAAETQGAKPAPTESRVRLESGGVSSGVKALQGAGGGFGSGRDGAGGFLENLESRLLDNSGGGAREIAEALSGAGFDKAPEATTAAAAPATESPGRQSALSDQIGNIERIAEIMRHNNRQGVQNLTLQLSPPELGKLLIRVENRGGRVSATFRVGHAESAAQLQGGLRLLKDNLRARGIELGEVEVREDPSLSGGDGDGEDGGAEPDRGGNVGGRSAGSRTDAADEADAVEAVETTAAGVDENGRLNLLA
jgi:hypothetical protein